MIHLYTPHVPRPPPTPAESCLRRSAVWIRTQLSWLNSVPTPAKKLSVWAKLAPGGASHCGVPRVAPSLGVGETVRAGQSVARRRDRCWIRIRDDSRQSR